VFIRWDYTETPRPDKERIKLLTDNYYCFDMEDYVEVIKDVDTNRKLVMKLQIPSENIKYFTLANNFTFNVPITSYRTTASHASPVSINPYAVAKESGSYFLYYTLYTPMSAKLTIYFQMRYQYFTLQNNTTVVYRRPPPKPVTQPTTQPTETPQTTQPTELTIPSEPTNAEVLSSTRDENDDEVNENTEEINEETIVPMKRSASLRSSIGRRKVSPSVENLNKIYDVPVSSQSSEVLNGNDNNFTPQVVYALNEKTHKILSRSAKNLDT
jgi:hypothetical protein